MEKIFGKGSMKRQKVRVYLPAHKKMVELDEKYGKLRKVAFKLAQEMDALAEEYALLKREKEARTSIKTHN